MDSSSTGITSSTVISSSTGSGSGSAGSSSSCMKVDGDKSSNLSAPLPIVNLVVLVLLAVVVLATMIAVFVYNRSSRRRRQQEGQRRQQVVDGRQADDLEAGCASAELIKRLGPALRWEDLVVTGGREGALESPLAATASGPGGGGGSGEVESGDLTYGAKTGFPRGGEPGNPRCMENLEGGRRSDSGGSESEKESDGGLCAVCLSELQRGDWVRRLPACGHVFHQECVDIWIHKRTWCPLCRTELFPHNEGEGAQDDPHVLCTIHDGGEGEASPRVRGVEAQGECMITGTADGHADGSPLSLPS